MKLDQAFSNGKWSVSVNTVGDLIKELQRLPPELAVNQGMGEGVDVTVFNRNLENPQVGFSEFGEWAD